MVYVHNYMQHYGSCLAHFRQGIMSTLSDVQAHQNKTQPGKTTPKARFPSHCDRHTCAPGNCIVATVKLFTKHKFSNIKSLYSFSKEALVSLTSTVYTESAENGWCALIAKGCCAQLRGIFTVSEI